MTKLGLSESALRRRADREGYKLIKSRKTGLYGLQNLSNGGLAIGWGLDATLEEVAAYLAPRSMSWKDEQLLDEGVI